MRNAPLVICRNLSEVSALNVWAAWPSLYISLSVCVCVMPTHAVVHICVIVCPRSEKVWFLPLSFTVSLMGRWCSDPSTFFLSHLPSVTLRSTHLVFSTSFFSFDSWLSSVWLTDIFSTLGLDRAFLMSHMNVLSSKVKERWLLHPHEPITKGLNWTICYFLFSFHAL